MPEALPKYGQRTLDDIKAHYRIEKKLAVRLLKANKMERTTLYSILYDQMLRRVPTHSRLLRKADPASSARHVAEQMRLLQRFLSAETTFLEVGAGDCSTVFEVAKQVRKTYAVEVSEEITRRSDQPDNFELILSDGSSIPVRRGSIDIIYSNQLMEHLHPEDAVDQLMNIYEALKPGGIYICVTPHRFQGPHDISKHFDTVATCFHLKEYTNRELTQLLTSVGFSKVNAYARYKGTFFQIPAATVFLIERMLDTLPFKKRKKLSRSFLFSPLLGIRLVATK